MRKAAIPFVVFGAAAAWLAGSGLGTAADPDGQAFDRIAKGRYLTTVADCYACHTVLNAGKPFAGGRPIETPFGIITSSNITPDAETGIGAWSDEQFDNAVRKGVRPDGSRLYPAMPFPAYTKMTRDDVLAIRAYLATVEPVHQPVKANTLPFPFNIREAMLAWDRLYFTEGEFQPDSRQSAAWNRGAYLVQGPGHCTACHTPKTFLGGDKSGDENLRGFNLQGWFAPDITGDVAQGLGQWSEADVTGYLKSGHNRMTAATGPMAEEIVNSTSQYNDSDLQAIATYLKSLPARQEAAPPRPDAASMKAGEAIYRDQCSACHGLDGKGVPMLFPSLAQSAMAHAGDPTSAIRLVLRGGRSVATDTEPTAPGMPSFGWQLDDAQVAAVVTYIRNAWQTAAAPVTADVVGKNRDQMRTRAD